MKVLVTGCAGFIGSHLVEHLIRKTDWDIVGIDKLNYASTGLTRLKESEIIYIPRFKFFCWDLAVKFSEGLTKEIGDINVIIHLAAESSVNYSVVDPVEVIRNNIMSTTQLLEYSRTLTELKVFHYFSTDEVFSYLGLNDPGYKETDEHHPTNPYSASKSASEQICMSYYYTFKIPIIISNLVNVFGERQFSEKFIPLVIKKLINDEKVNIFVDENNVPSSRFYIHARNVADAVLFILNNGTIGEKYNITSNNEYNNLELAKKIAKIVGKELKYDLVKSSPERPFNDPRYALDGSKLFTLGWKAPVDFDHSLENTVNWTLKHTNWL